MSSVCWLEDRDERLRRARALAATDPAAALALVGSVLAEVPDDLEALRAKAEILGELGDPAAARACLERLAALDPRDARVLIDLGDLERDPDRARTLYERAIAVLDARGDAGPDRAAAERGLAATLVARRAS